jgi:hypothetical protein
MIPDKVTGTLCIINVHKTFYFLQILLATCNSCAFDSFFNREHQIEVNGIICWRQANKSIVKHHIWIRVNTVQQQLHHTADDVVVESNIWNIHWTSSQRQRTSNVGFLCNKCEFKEILFLMCNIVFDIL